MGEEEGMEAEEEGEVVESGGRVTYVQHTDWLWVYRACPYLPVLQQAARCSGGGVSRVARGTGGGGQEQQAQQRGERLRGASGRPHDNVGGRRFAEALGPTGRAGVAPCVRANRVGQA